MDNERTELMTDFGKEILSKWERGIMSADDIYDLSKQYAVKMLFHPECHDMWYDLWTIESEYLPD